MIIVRFKITCQPGRTDDAIAVMRDVVGPSRRLDGVIEFDIGHDIADPNSIIATEVFEDRAALDRQESLDEVAAVMALLPDVLASEPEAMIYHVASVEPYA